MLTRAGLATVTSLFVLACAGAHRSPEALPIGPKGVPSSAGGAVDKDPCAKISSASARVLKTLKRPMRVDAYVTRGLPHLDDFVRRLTDLLGLYAAQSDGRFGFSIIEAKTEELQARAKEAGLKYTSFSQSVAPGQPSIRQGYLGLAFEYGGEIEIIPIIEPDRSDGLEFWITNKIRELRDKADGIRHKIGVVSGHQEIKLTDRNLVSAKDPGAGPSIQGIIETAFPSYEIVDVDLKGGDAKISDELIGLIVTQPGVDYTDKELRRIDQFLMLGHKSLAVYASAANLQAGDASMRATLSTHRLERLLFGYGIEMKRDVVLDFEKSLRVPLAMRTGEIVWLRAPSVVQVGRDAQGLPRDQPLAGDFACFFRADELSFPFPSTLLLHPEKQPAAKMRAVAITGLAHSTAWSETTDLIELKMATTWPPRQPLSAKIIAANVEGTLKSAMGVGEGIDVPAQSKDESRIFVVSSSQFLANPFVRSGMPAASGASVGGDEQLLLISQPYAQKFLTGTILSFKNTLDWMISDSDLLETLGTSCMNK